MMNEIILIWFTQVENMHMHYHKHFTNLSLDVEHIA